MRSLLIGALFALAAGAITAWTREQPLVTPGRVMTVTRTVRAQFEVEDVEATNSKRAFAQSSAPRVFVADRTALQQLQTSLENLPTTLADAQSLDQVAEEIREVFALTEKRLAAIRLYASRGEADQSWGSKVRSLLRRLRVVPVVDRETWQRTQQAPTDRIELRYWDAPPAELSRDRIVNIESPRFSQEMQTAVRRAGFEDVIATLIVDRMIRERRPTFTFDQAATEELGRALAESIEPVMVKHPAGRVIYRRGERLDDEAYALRLAEAKAYLAQTPRYEIWLERVDTIGVAMLIAIAVAFYLSRFCSRITRNPLRVLAISTLMLGALLIASVATTAAPNFVYLFAVAPVLFIAVITVIAYDQRTAIALASMEALLIAVALDQSLGFLAISISGAGLAVGRLGEIRQRNTLIRAGAVSAIALMIVTALVELIESPIVPAIWAQMAWDAALAGLGGVLVGFITLGILPSVERLFDITTGMTLIELRDPKHPLLRALQQRAPGTYNHSLNVATLAESAADAIGADGLHVYVGALYHDVGKMNKPEYFVENQTGGMNLHSRLSPAMSLLVIVGHVKDGVELAREYNLPRSLHHYIESHHGVTLVAYFYHAAQQQAKKQGDADQPDEIEYRYAGPKPHTKEAAILMLCDTVESAARTMSDPSPSRIEAIVHKLANDRLLDGQFDECDLTLRELHVIEASLVKSLNSMYHARIEYPVAKSDEKKSEAQTAIAGASHG